MNTANIVLPSAVSRTNEQTNEWKPVEGPSGLSFNHQQPSTNKL